MTPVDKKKLEKVRKQIARLLKKEFPAVGDPDWDSLVEFTLVDRSRYERLHYMPLPYDRGTGEGGAARDVIESIAMMNLGIAYQALDLNHRLKRLETR